MSEPNPVMIYTSAFYDRICRKGETDSDCCGARFDVYVCSKCGQLCSPVASPEKP